MSCFCKDDLMRVLSRLWLCVLASCGVLWAPASLAQPVAHERVILQISGQIGAGRVTSFDLAALDRLPQHHFTTRTPWDNGPVRFSGPLLRDVLAAVQAQGNEIKATALNDYRITIPLEDAKRFNLLLATRIGGQPIPVRTKGPLFIVYPFDTDRQLQSNTYYERSIWQLKSIEVH
jgi:hypothetical protein